MNISQKLISGLMLIIASTVLIGYFAITESQKVLEDSIINNSSASVKVMMAEIERNIYHRIEGLKDYSRNSALRKFLAQSNRTFDDFDNIQGYINEHDEAWKAASDEMITPFMQALINNEISLEMGRKVASYEEEYGYKIYGEIFIANKYGANAAQTGKTSDYYQADEEWWQEAKENGFYQRDIAYDKSAGVYSLDIGIRIVDHEENFLGVLKAVLNIEEIVKVLKRHQLADQEEAISELILASNNGKIIYSTEKFKFLEDIAEDVWSKIQEDDEAQFIHKGSSSYGGKLLIHSHSHGFKDFKNLGWILIEQYKTKEIFAPVEELKNTILVMVIGLLFGGIIVGIAVVNSILSPIESLRAAAVEISKGNLNTTVKVQTKDEIGFLAETFNKMIADLKSQQEQLVERSAKEVQDIKFAMDQHSIIAITDQKGIINYANDNFCKISGYSKEELLGANHRIIKSDYHSKDFFRDLWRTIASGKVWYGEVKNKNKHGSYYWVNTTIVPFLNEQGKPYQYLSFRTDITARKTIEISLSEEKSKMDSLVESMKEGVVMLDGRGNAVVINSQAYKMLGLSKNEPNFNEEFQKRIKLVDLDKALEQSRKKNVLVQKEINMPHNEKQTLLCNICPVKSKDHDLGVAIIFRDISLEKEVDAAKTEFISTVSHELRTPLAITKEGLSLILDKIAGNITEKQEMILNTAQDNISRLSRLINNLLDISKIEAGKMEIRNAKLDVVALTKKVLADFEFKAKEKNLDLQIKYPESQIDVFADRDKIIQVFTNLISNALKFTAKGYIRISAKSLGEFIEFTVADTGIGITKENLKRTFSKFQQFGRVAGAGEKGTGLGLSIAKGIVEMHGGTIKVESELGVGTKFIFTLRKFSEDLPLQEFIQNRITEARKSAEHLSLVVVNLQEIKNSHQHLPIEKQKRHLKTIESLLNADLHRKGDSTFRDERRCAALIVNCDKGHTNIICERVRGTMTRYMAQEELNGKIDIKVRYAIYPDDARNGVDLLNRVKTV